MKRCEAGHNPFSQKTKTETEILAGEEVKAAQLFFEVGKARARVQKGALSGIGTQPIASLNFPQKRPWTHSRHVAALHVQDDHDPGRNHRGLHIQ